MAKEQVFLLRVDIVADEMETRGRSMNPSKWYGSALGCLLAAALCVSQALAADGVGPVFAESGKTATIYTGGDIITVSDRRPEAEAVAVRDGRVVVVGTLAEVKAAAGAGATVRDLDGRALLPGFIDAHGHLTYVNNLQLSANIASPPVGSATTIDDVITLLKAHRAKMPQAPWIVGFGYDDSLLAEKRHPTRDDLDRVSTELPVAVTHVSGHLMSCNSRCLELAGIDAGTADPAGGVIRRRAGGTEPDGVLEETAMYLLMEVMPTADRALQVQLLEQTQRYYASYGLTTIQEGAVQREGLEVLQAAADAHKLYLDVVSFPHQTLSLEGVREFPPSSTYRNHYRVGGIKVHLDGSPQGKTAWLSKPYFHPPHGQPDDYAGYPTLTDEELQSFVDYAFEKEVPLLAHANGDAAADQMLNAVKVAGERFGPADRRPVMIHAQTVREDQLQLMVEEGVIPSYFVAHTFFWGDWHRDSVLGKERAARISPLRSSAGAGLRYTVHNDSPVVPPDMMRLLWTAVNRVTRSGQVLGEAQRATVMEAIRAITIDGAYQYFEEQSKGSIEPGKRADLVILSDNPLKVDPMALKDIEVLETIKDGVTVYRR
jgi:predicted amidohydrolase YtcJ